MNFKLFIMDPIAEMLTTIRNCQATRKEKAEVSYSKVKEAICKILFEKQIINGYKVNEPENQKVINISLSKSSICHLRRISKPGRRVYIKAKDIRFPLSGLGYLIISTPRGMVESREARKLGLGGEVICEVW